MTRVLVDTSVWAEHFRQPNEVLKELLELDLVMVHPMILGEIACGTPPARANTLANLARLQPTQQASLREVMVFIERERLFGQGCGLIDITLLASALMTPGVVLWSLDKRLDALAGRFGVKYQPALH